MNRSEVSTSSQKSEQRRHRGPRFTKADYLVVRRALDELSLIEKLAVEMRFFHNFSIEEISRLLRIGWDEAESLVESALPILRRYCLSDPDFSGSCLRLRAA
jgi:DNA-directed RNA polymerase specialized sigma24 family protein